MNAATIKNRDFVAMQHQIEIDKNKTFLNQTK
jgi:hypothetical protein